MDQTPTRNDVSPKSLNRDMSDAESRAIFARGALAAARFLHGKPAGLYSMRDVIEAQ